MRSLGFAILDELTLATGRRADVIAFGDSGAIWIIEIESWLMDFKVDQKWPSTATSAIGFLSPSRKPSSSRDHSL